MCSMFQGVASVFIPQLKHPFAKKSPLSHLPKRLRLLPKRPHAIYMVNVQPKRPRVDFRKLMMKG